MSFSALKLILVESDTWKKSNKYEFDFRKAFYEITKKNIHKTFPKNIFLFFYTIMILFFTIVHYMNNYSNIDI